jgi:hypothetical protein
MLPRDILKQAANKSFNAGGSAHLNFGCLHRCTPVRAAGFLIGFLLLTSNLYFQLGSGTALDEQ